MEFAHVNSEVLELILLGLLQDQLGALSDGIDAAQVASGVEGWVGGFGKRHVWEARGPGAVWGGARGSQRAIGGVRLAAVGRDDGLGALATEESHDGGGDSNLRVFSGDRCGRRELLQFENLGRYGRSRGCSKNPHLIPVRTSPSPQQASARFA